jgi:hypothetical protein
MVVCIAFFLKTISTVHLEVYDKNQVSALLTRSDSSITETLAAKGYLKLQTHSTVKRS